MTLKQIRNELDALRGALNSPAAMQHPSALTDISARLDRLAARQCETQEQPTATAMAGLATWWQQQFGKELHG